MRTAEQYRQEFVSYLESHVTPREPQNLYEPISYILGLGGKRLRPVLTLMTAEVFGTTRAKALNAALAVEIFHNFSLVHDDIMDAAPIRRGQTTVHEKWDLNTGILSGDAMLILAYQLFESYDDATFRSLAQLFSKTALEVCEGQQYDIDFAGRNDVTIPEYLKMISYKTAVLVAAAMQMGAIIAGADKKSQQGIYAFGLNLGIAFQLQDDYLDVFGDPKAFGKQLGGDIIENKKTFLYLKALELSELEQKERLQQLYVGQPEDSLDKVQTVKGIFRDSGAAQRTKEEIASYTEKAFCVLDALGIAQTNKESLRAFGEQLMARQA